MNYENNIIGKRYTYKLGIIDSYHNSKIYDPEEMMRILFYNYRKKLNNENYTWKKSMNKIESFWERAEKGKGWVSQKVRKYENEKLVEYHFNQ